MVVGEKQKSVELVLGIECGNPRYENRNVEGKVKTSA